MTKLSELEKQLSNLQSRKENAQKQLQLAKEKKLEITKKEKELARKIEKEISEKARKERTKRLIEIGAMIESIAGGELDLYKFQSYLNQYKLEISALKKQRSN